MKMSWRQKGLIAFAVLVIVATVLLAIIGLGIGPGIR
jgi:hypothetical protein